MTHTPELSEEAFPPDPDNLPITREDIDHQVRNLTEDGELTRDEPNEVKPRLDYHGEPNDEDPRVTS